MKQIHTHICALLLLVILAASCNKDAPTTEFYEGENFYYFSLEEITELESIPDQIAAVVHYSTRDGGNGTASFSVNPDSTSAILDTDYTITNSSSDLSFSADNNYSDTIFIDIIDNEEFTGGIIEIYLELGNTTNGKAGFVGPANIKSGIKILILDDDCPTRNIAGEYTTTTTGTSTDPCCPDATTVEGEVTVVEIGDGLYEIFDFTAGLYGFWYDIFGVTPEFVDGGGLTRELSVLCDNVTGEFTEPFNTTATVTGKVDLSSGVVTYTWVNGFDDTATVTLTPK